MSSRFPFKMLAIAAALTQLSVSAAADVTPLGEFNMPLGISGDGNVAVGQVYSPGQGMTATIWKGGQATSLGKPAGYSDTYGQGISGDGKIVVGEAANFDADYHARAFKWTAAGGMVLLDGLVAGQNSTAAAISSDGNVIVGKATLADGMNQHAVRWVGANSAIQDINGNGFTYSSAQAVSGDGGVVVGYGQNGDGIRAFRWSQSGGMASLGVLEGKTGSEATGVSADGNVVTGTSYVIYGADPSERAFRWTQAGGMSDLGALPGTSYSRASAINGDGTVIVGYAYQTWDARQAFRWSQSGGMQSISQWLGDNGVNVGSAKFYDASGVSANGNVVVGTGELNGKNQGYIARVGNGGGGGGVIGTDDFAGTLAGAGGSMGVGGNFARMAMFGAHHRVLADNGLASGKCFWATGDLGGASNGSSRQYLGEVGVCGDFGPWRLGVGVGGSHVGQDLQLGGSSKFNGGHVYAEADYRFGNGLVASLAGFYGAWNADVNRRYMNGAIIDSSTGSTDVQATAGRVRLDWLELARVGSVALSPFAAYSHIETRADAYTETGGGFPIQFASNRQTERDFRAGLTASLRLNDTADLRVSAEGIHRFDTRGQTAGTVIGVGAFSLPGVRGQENQARFGTEVDYRLTRNSVLNASAHVTTGSDANYVASVGWKLGF